MFNSVETLIYRGFLRTCNYTCNYCPFSKTTQRDLSKDHLALDQMISVLPQFKHPINLMITPYGEALIHRHYLKALATISKQTSVKLVGCQTNASFSVNQFVKVIEDSTGQIEKIRLWCSFHPSQISAERFLEQCLDLHKAGFIFSVGAVADYKMIEQFRLLKAKLPKTVYFWLNANEMRRTAYAPNELQAFLEIDPQFSMEISHYPADTKQCLAGRKSIFMNADGDIFACNISNTKLGNLYQNILLPTQCTAKECSCYLAYFHRTDIPELDVFGDNKIFRVPSEFQTKTTADY